MSSLAVDIEDFYQNLVKISRMIQDSLNNYHPKYFKLADSNDMEFQQTWIFIAPLYHTSNALPL